MRIALVERWWFLLLFLAERTSRNHGLVMAQQQQRREQDRRSRRKRQQNSQHHEEKDASPPNFEYMKNTFEELHQQHQHKLKALSGPKHVLEGLWNTALVSGTAAIAGLASAVGFPLVVVLFPSSSGDNSMRSNENENSTTGRISFGQRIVRLIVGSLIGGIIAGTCWITGLIYAIWQLAVGIWRTPGTIWAQVDGRPFYDTVNQTWHTYNLTQQWEDLQGSGGGKLSSLSDGTNGGDASLYTVLGLTKEASRRDVKRAYYQMAKEYHPDKNPNASQEEQDLFLDVHQAYETLYNVESRQQYDRWGVSSSQDNNNALPLDTNIFFDLLFGVSPELEPYIGDLQIKASAGNVLQLIVRAQAIQQQQSSSSETNQSELLNQLFATFFFKGHERRELRQVEIAMHLSDFIQPFVEGVVSVCDFEILCQEEAERILESTPFSIFFLQSIGQTLYWQSSTTSATTWFSFQAPRAVWSWTHHCFQSVSTKTWWMRSMIELSKSSTKQFEKAEEWLSEQVALEQGQHQQRRKWRHQSEGPYYSDMESKERASVKFQKTMEFMLPSAMELVWKYNQEDIASTLQGALWKVLHAIDDDDDDDYRRMGGRRRQRRIQVQALHILGRTFLEQTKKASDAQYVNTTCRASTQDHQNDEDEGSTDNPPNGHDDESCTSSDGDKTSSSSSLFPDVDQERIARAFQMATSAQESSRSKQSYSDGHDK